MPTFPFRHEKLVLKIVAAVSVCVLLVATLWPLNPWLKNEVSWLQYDDGVRLCKHGIILSVGQFPNEAGAESEPFSLEVCMEPWRDEGSTVILAFYERENPETFILRQDGLAVSILHATGKRGKEDALASGDVIVRDKRTLVTVTSGPKGMTLYVNGQAQRFWQYVRLSRKNLTGELVIGTSPVASKCWCGVLRGIAIYSNELTAQEAAGHYGTWSLNRVEDIQDAQSMLALYLFRERSGRLVKNEIQPGSESFDTQVLHPLAAQLSAVSMERVPARMAVCERSHLERARVCAIGSSPISLLFGGYGVKAALVDELRRWSRSEPAD
jgi:hypothetical protein